MDDTNSGGRGFEIGCKLILTYQSQHADGSLERDRPVMRILEDQMGLDLIIEDFSLRETTNQVDRTPSRLSSFEESHITCVNDILDECQRLTILDDRVGVRNDTKRLLSIHPISEFTTREVNLKTVFTNPFDRSGSYNVIEIILLESLVQRLSSERVT
jgi:hypothetical protein